MIPKRTQKHNEYQSECFTCPEAYCCCYLPLCRLLIDTKDDLYKALYFTEFKGFFLGLKSDGSWTVYYSTACKYLDKKVNRCLIHENQDYPSICKNYSAHLCWYITAFKTHASERFIKFNKDRLSKLIQMITYDQNGTIIKIPSWDEIIKECSNIHFDNNPIFAKVDSEYTLLFPPKTPVKPTHLSLIHFRLNFPGLTFHYDKNESFFSIKVNPNCSDENHMLKNTLDKGELEQVIESFSGHERKYLHSKHHQLITGKNFHDLEKIFS